MRTLDLKQPGRPDVMHTQRRLRSGRSLTIKFGNEFLCTLFEIPILCPHLFIFKRFGDIVRCYVVPICSLRVGMFWNIVGRNMKPSRDHLPYLVLTNKTLIRRLHADINIRTYFSHFPKPFLKMSLTRPTRRKFIHQKSNHRIFDTLIDSLSQRIPHLVHVRSRPFPSREFFRIRNELC